MSAFENEEITILASAARTASVTVSLENRTGRGLAMWVNVTAASGTTPTLNIKLQGVCPVSGVAFDIPGAALAEITDDTGDQDFVLYPGVAETNNVSVSDVLPRTFNVVSTIAGTDPSFTYSIGGCILQ